ncbi:MAG: hypothetical protein JRG94_22405, partial [Deltaproteobacteria bacterium]|nr:hypothetical protein [Deltaproteobacteria bacterium]
GLRFDLARSFEAQGDVARAKEAFEAAKAADATIPGVDECIARVTQRLESGDGPLGGDSDSAAAEGFESFDDLIAEVEADESPDADEAFESFDDIVAEAEASDAMPEELEVASVAVEEELAAESQAEVACEPEPEPPASKSDAKKPKKPKKKKKKRISFV